MPANGVPAALQAPELGMAHASSGQQYALDANDRMLLYDVQKRLQGCLSIENFGLESIQATYILAVGNQSSGKSSVIQSTLNTHFNLCTHGIGSRAPLEVFTYSTPDCKEPEFAFRTPQSPAAALCSLEELKERVARYHKSLADKNQVTNSALSVTIRWSEIENYVMVDLPGLQPLAVESQETQEQIEDLVMSRSDVAFGNDNAIVLVVEGAGDPACFSVFERMRRRKRELHSRTKLVLVCNKLDLLAKACAEDQAAADPLVSWVRREFTPDSWTRDGCMIYFVSCPVLVATQPVPSIVDFQRMLEARSVADKAFIEQYLPAFVNHAGILNLRGLLVDTQAQLMRQDVPRMLDMTTNMIRTFESEIADAAREDTRAWCDKHLQEFAGAFTENIKAAMVGETEVPRQYWLTLEQEYHTVRPQGLNLSYRTCPEYRRHSNEEFRREVGIALDGLGDAALFGGAQLTRLFQEIQLGFFIAVNTAAASTLLPMQEAIAEIKNFRYSRAGSLGTLQPYSAVAVYYMKKLYKDRYGSDMDVFTSFVSAIMKSWATAVLDLTVQQFRAKHEHFYVPELARQTLIKSYHTFVDELSNTTLKIVKDFIKTTMTIPRVVAAPVEELSQDDDNMRRVSFVKQYFRRDLRQVSLQLDDSTPVEEAFAELERYCHEQLLRGARAVADSIEAIYEVQFRDPFVTKLQTLMAVQMDQFRQAILDEQAIAERLETLQGYLAKLHALQGSLKAASRRSLI